MLQYLVDMSHKHNDNTLENVQTDDRDRVGETRWDEWSHLVQCKDQRRTPVSTVMNLRAT
jgi:hypothetical protein